MIADGGICLFKFGEMFHSPEYTGKNTEYPFSVKYVQCSADWTDVIFYHSIITPPGNYGITSIFGSVENLALSEV